MTLLISSPPDASATVRGLVSTGTQTIAGAKTFSTSIAMTSSVTYTVKTSGGDFTTVGDAVTAARKLITSPGVGVTISIDDGTWNVAGYLGGGNNQGFLIQGVNTYAKTLSSVQSSSGSAGARSYILNLNTVTNIAVNDYVVIKDTSGGTNPTYLAGVFKVTNVDTGNVRITISSTHHAAAAASGSVIGTVTVMKTVLNFTGGASGFRLWDKSYLVLQNVVVVGDGTNNGISVQDLSRFYGLGTLGIVNWAIGLLLTECGEAVVETLAISNCTTAGMYLDKHSTSTVFTMAINGCGTDGLYLLNNAFVELLGNSVVTGTTNRGITLFAGSVVRVSVATSVNSSGNNYGASISQAGTVFGTLTYSNNAVNTLYGDSLFGGNVGINAPVPVSLLQVGGSVDISWGAGPFSTGMMTLGTGGSLGSLWINAPTGNSAFNGGIGFNSIYDGTLQVTGRLGVYGVKAGGGYGSTLILSTTNGTTINDGLKIDKTGLVTRPLTDKVAIVAATLTTTSSTYANVTALSFAIAASTTWTAEFTLYCTGSLGGIKFQITGPASPTSVAIDTEGNTTANTVYSHDLVTAFSTPSGAYDVNVVPFTGLIKISVTVVNGANAGTIQLQYASATNTESNSVLLNSKMNARRVS